MQGATEPPNDTETTDTDFQTAFVRIVRVLSIGMMVFVLVVLFFPVGHKFAIFGAFVAMISSLEFVIHQSNKRQSIESWMRWVPVFWAMLIYSFSVYQNNLYPITALPTVLAINYIFLPRAAGRIVSMAAFSVAFLPLARGVEVDMAMWIRLITFSVIGVMILEFVANIGYRMFRSLEVSRQKLRVALDESSSLNHQLERAKEAAETANHSKDEFLASMSHELRTPLTSLLGNCDMMVETGLDEVQSRLQTSMEVSGKSLLYLINDILDNSKIKAGKFQIDHAAFDLSVLLRELRYIFQKRAEESGLSSEVVEKIDTGIYCMGDGNRITQILVNLLGNAVKFTRSGGVQLKVDRDSVLSHLTFTVRDTGIGMSDEVIERLFQPFEQANREISNRFGGTGLGLFISSNLVELMHGKLTVESEEGSGSCFTLSLPLEILEQTELKGNVQQEQAVAVTQCQGNILIAEDAPELQLLERRMVEQLGPMVDVASNGVEAVSKAMSKDYDLILMDMQMPQMDGIEATRTLREQGVTVPIVALTANVMEHHKAQFYEAGCNDFLAKPIDRQLLAEVFVKYCR